MKTFYLEPKSENEKNFNIKVVLTDLRPYRKNIIYGIFENKYNRHICPYMGLQWYIGLVAAMFSHDVTVKSLKT